MTLTLMEDRLAVCRLAPGEALPAWAASGGFVSATRTKEELSVVCAASAVPPGVTSETGWRIFQVEGPLDFALTGILVSVARPLAEAGVSIFAISTYDTDYVMVKEGNVAAAAAALAAAGHAVKGFRTGLRRGHP